jgi:hypothetical protein
MVEPQASVGRPEADIETDAITAPDREVAA